MDSADPIVCDDDSQFCEKISFQEDITMIFSDLNINDDIDV